MLQLDPGEALAREFLSLESLRAHIEERKCQTSEEKHFRRMTAEMQRTASLTVLTRRLQREEQEQHQSIARNQIIRQQASILQKAPHLGAVGSKSEALERIQNSKAQFVQHIEQMSFQWQAVMEQQLRKEIDAARKDAAHCQSLQSQKLEAASRQESLYSELLVEQRRAQEERERLRKLDAEVQQRNASLRQRLASERASTDRQFEVRPRAQSISTTDGQEEALQQQNPQRQPLGKEKARTPSKPSFQSSTSEKPTPEKSEQEASELQTRYTMSRCNFVPPEGTRQFEVYQTLRNCELEMQSDLKLLEAPMFQQSAFYNPAAETPCSWSSSIPSKVFNLAPRPPAVVVEGSRVPNLQPFPNPLDSAYHKQPHQEVFKSSENQVFPTPLSPAAGLPAAVSPSPVPQRIVASQTASATNHLLNHDAIALAYSSSLHRPEVLETGQSPSFALQNPLESFAEEISMASLGDLLQASALRLQALGQNKPEASYQPKEASVFVPPGTGGVVQPQGPASSATLASAASASVLTKRLEVSLQVIDSSILDESAASNISFGETSTNQKHASEAEARVAASTSTARKSFEHDEKSFPITQPSAKSMSATSDHQTGEPHQLHTDAATRATDDAATCLDSGIHEKKTAGPEALPSIATPSKIQDSLGLGGSVGSDFTFGAGSPSHHSLPSNSPRRDGLRQHPTGMPLSTSSSEQISTMEQIGRADSVPLPGSHAIESLATLTIDKDDSPVKASSVPESFNRAEDTEEDELPLPEKLAGGRVDASVVSNDYSKASNSDVSLGEGPTGTELPKLTSKSPHTSPSLILLTKKDKPAQLLAEGVLDSDSDEAELPFPLKVGGHRVISPASRDPPLMSTSQRTGDNPSMAPQLPEEKTPHTKAPVGLTPGSAAARLVSDLGLDDSLNSDEDPLKASLGPPLSEDGSGSASKMSVLKQKPNPLARSRGAGLMGGGLWQASAKDSFIGPGAGAQVGSRAFDEGGAGFGVAKALALSKGAAKPSIASVLSKATSKSGSGPKSGSAGFSAALGSKIDWSQAEGNW